MLVPFPILSPPPPSLSSPLSLQNPNPNLLRHLHDLLFFILDLPFLIIIILSNRLISFFSLFSKLATSAAPSLGFYSLRLMEGGDGGGSKKECSSKASSDDHSSTDQSTDDASSGRFYECIFCKRGFSTAQALGGHMNIHRKDRAKMKHNPSASKLGEDESEGGYGCYAPYLNHSNHRSFYPPVSESLKNYSMFFPVAASLQREDGMRRRELSLFGEDHLHLGSRVHGEERHVGLGCEERRERAKEGEVDLELRLGP